MYPRRERRVQTLLFPEFRIPVPTDHHTVHTNNHNHISYYGRYILESYVRRKILSAVTQLTSNSILTELVGAVGCGGWSSCLASCGFRVRSESTVSRVGSGRCVCVLLHCRRCHVNSFSLLLTFFLPCAVRVLLVSTPSPG